MQVTEIHRLQPNQALHVAQDAAAVLQAGGLVVFPTETVYGLAALATSDKGIEALRQFKGRPQQQPFTLHLPDWKSAQLYIDLSHPMLQRIVRKVFPGPITLIVEVSDATIREKLSALGLGSDSADRIYSNNTVGLRCPDHAFAQQMLAAVPGPVVASSANARHELPPYDAHQAAAAVGQAAQLIIDAGRCRYSKPSTIVHLRMLNGRVVHKVERVGVYDERFISKFMRSTILFVCSGNTCRSPMAEAFAKQMLAEKHSITPDDLEAAGLRVSSAGVAAVPGMPASQGAVQVLQESGYDLSKHRSRPLTLEAINEADAIYCMTRSHLKAVTQLAPAAHDKTLPLNPDADVEDPVGEALQVYQECGQSIRKFVAQRLNEFNP